MKKTYILTFSGKAGSGKDTAYNYVKDFLPEDQYIVERFAYADPVKEFAAKYFPELVKDKSDKTTRKLWQGIGNGIREEIDLDYWIFRLAQTVGDKDKEYSEKFPDKTFVAVITDARYLNELTAFYGKINPSENTQLIGNVYRIDKRTYLEGTAAQHISETQLDEVDYKSLGIHVYENTGTEEEFKKDVLEWTHKTLNQY